MYNQASLWTWLQAPKGNFFKFSRTLLFLVLMMGAGGLFAIGGQKMILQKVDQFRKPKIHPHVPLLSKAQPHSQIRNGVNYKKLLVLLVEFQEETEDDPNTTGNGRFQLQPDSEYLYSIGSPPHDREYFMANLEALRYYYLAASAGSFDLEYTVFPLDGTAITLSHPLGYYNPPNASGELFVQRMEEYFTEVFTLADQLSPQIDFSLYAHYMIIHAGSDWQHDVFGDTPSDLPSFFIRVSDEKAVSVNSGVHKIYHACNVPATISQDFGRETMGDVDVLSGYGALNSVIIHEFGHSLGLVDLYNVYSFQPMVGVFDIMDSGGGGILLDELNDGTLVLVEGILPALPGAFSRALLFEDYFTQAGYLKELHQLPINTPISLAASSLKQSGTIQPTIYKIPLSEKEYILIENRSVDPDGDGATAVFGTLDSRVVLYPTPLNDHTNQPTYEYDYLLPSFQKANGDAMGGGMLVWHINDDVIYGQGRIDADGSWISNFENNTVNTDYHNRGVRVIEADGLSDIGNYYSMFWTGTPYEYFHKSRPVLDVNGAFVNWALEAWKPSLGPETEPALKDTKDTPPSFWLSDISSPAPVMNFQICSGFFDGGDILRLPAGSVLAPLINSSYEDCQLPVISPSGFHLYSTLADQWYDMVGEFAYTGELSQTPIIKSNQNQHVTGSYDEIVLNLEDRLRLIEVWRDNPDITDIDLGAPPTLQPIADDTCLYAASSGSLYQIVNNSIVRVHALQNAKALAIAGADLLVLRENGFVLIDRFSFADARSYRLEGSFGDYQPAVFKKEGTEDVSIFLMDNSGNLWNFSGGALTKIFTNHSTTLPTQIGILATAKDSPVVFFGLGKNAFAMLADGTLLSGFPYQSESAEYESGRQVFAIRVQQQVLMQLPVKNSGYFAISTSATVHPLYSLGLPHPVQSDFIHFDQLNKKLYWYYSDDQADLYYQWVALEVNPILWAGHRNGGDGQFTGTSYHGEADARPITAYVYPNPVTSSPLRVRAEQLRPYPVLIKVFDAAGSLVLQESFEDNGIANRDFQLPHKLASGVYFLTIKNGSYGSRIKFAVTK